MSPKKKIKRQTHLDPVWFCYYPGEPGIVGYLCTVPQPFVCWSWKKLASEWNASSETQRQLVGAGKSLNLRREKIRAKKSSSPEFFLARLHFIPPPLTALESPRMSGMVSVRWIYLHPVICCMRARTIVGIFEKMLNLWHRSFNNYEFEFVNR